MSFPFAPKPIPLPINTTSSKSSCAITTLLFSAFSTLYILRPLNLPLRYLINFFSQSINARISSLYIIAKTVFPSVIKRESSRHHSLQIHTADRLRSEEHTSELQSRFDLVCRLLLE